MTAAKSEISGILAVDKAPGVTSHHSVAIARKTLGIKKIGHAGTLDPFATGLLMLMIGEATKLSDYLMEGEKAYCARIKLGEKTDTGDLTGKIVETSPYGHLSEADIKRILPDYTGKICQTPPMFSAIKHDGIPLYRLARKGIEIERKTREVVIKKIELATYSPPYVTLNVVCSKGTYLRTLAEDIAESLGTRGHLVALRRERIGPFSVCDALSTAELEEHDKILGALQPLQNALPLLPEVEIGVHTAGSIRQGKRLLYRGINRIGSPYIARGNKIKLIDAAGELVAIAETLINLESGSGGVPDIVAAKSVRVFNSGSKNNLYKKRQSC